MHFGKNDPETIFTILLNHCIIFLGHQ